MLYQFLWPTQIAAAITLDFYFLKGIRNSLLPSASHAALEITQFKGVRSLFYPLIKAVH